MIGASGTAGNVVTSRLWESTEVCACRSSATWPRSVISSAGSVRICCPCASVRIPCTRYTGPVRGCVRIGVRTVAEPIRVLAGQASIWLAATEQTCEELFGSSASDSGSVTLAERRFAWPSPEVSVATTDGCLPAAV